jgi:hypothetical protein
LLLPRLPVEPLEEDLRLGQLGAQAEQDNTSRLHMAPECFAISALVPVLYLSFAKCKGGLYLPVCGEPCPCNGIYRLHWLDPAAVWRRRIVTD